MGTELAISTVSSAICHLFGAYERLTGLSVPSSARNECTILNVMRDKAPLPKEKRSATYDNLFAIISQGIFSPKAGMRLWRERIQCALLLLLLAYAAARPGEIVRNLDWTDALRYKDLEWFLTRVWDSEGKAHYHLTCDVTLRNLKGLRKRTTLSIALSRSTWTTLYRHAWMQWCSSYFWL